MKLGIPHRAAGSHAAPQASAEVRRPFGLQHPWSRPAAPAPLALNVRTDRAARLGHSFARLAGAGSQPESPAPLPIQRSKARDTYDASGEEKWREFIDAKDHDAALAAVTAKTIRHPGEYYDYRPDEQGKMSKVGEHWKAFQKADAYVSQSIDDKTELDAREYMKVHQLVAGGLSGMNKGWRENEVTWGLQDPSKEKVENLTSKGLQVEPAQKGATVRVPAPTRPMAQEVEALFTKYHETRKTLPHAAAFNLYKQLEVLHPTKDASARTNHLILNRLMAENGLAPAILNEPNTPEQSYQGVTENLIGSSRRGFEVAMRQDTGSVERLRDSRKEQHREEEENRQADELLSGRLPPNSLSQQQQPTTKALTPAQQKKMELFTSRLFGKK